MSLDVIEFSEALHIAVDGGRLGMAQSVLEQNFQVVGIALVIMLPIAEIVLAQLTGEPVDTAGPTQPSFLQNQLHARVVGEPEASVVRTPVPAVHRDQEPIVAVGLLP